MKRLWLLLLLLIAGCGRVEPAYKQDINKSYLQLIHNRERGLKGIQQLEYDKDLEEFAQKWSENMASRRILKHSNLGFVDYRHKGENIAMGQRDEDEVLESWMGSTGHRRNIIDHNFTHVGFGCARTKDGMLYWCTCFGGN